jgi:tripartite-type tricarboxylate transporter receptor subunit TctC
MEACSRTKSLWRATCLAAILIVLFPRPGVTQEFYKGKTVTLFAGQPPGGGIDSEMRLVAAHLGHYIPGEPAIQPRNMPGAGGIALGNHLYTAVAPDGLTLGMPGRAGFVLGSITNEKGTRYDVRKFTWIGSAAKTNFIFWVRNSTGIANIAGLRSNTREIIVAGSGSTTANSVIPEILAKYEGLKLRVVRGYLGIADAVLAVERGEADAIFCDRASLRPDMISHGVVTPVFQTFAAERGLPTIDTLMTNPRERQLIALLTMPMGLGLAVIGPPGLPPDLTALLRNSYAKMVRSPEYRAEAAARRFEIGDPNNGEDLARRITETFAATPSEVIAEYRSFAARN